MNQDDSRPTDHLRSLPANLDAEAAVLSCCLRDPGASMPRVQAALGGGELAAQAFYSPAHRVIWAAMEALYRQKSVFDLVMLMDLIRDAEELTAIGGPAKVADLLDDVPTTGMLDHYLDLIIDKAVRRGILTQVNRIAEKAWDIETDRVAIINEAEAALFKLRELGTDRADVIGPRAIAPVLDEVIESLQSAFENRGKTTRGIPSGFVEFDRMTLGLEPGKVYVIAARPAQGKTSFAMNVVEHVARVAKVPSLVVSLEMSANELVQRMLTSAAEVDVYRMRDGFFKERDIQNLLLTKKDLATAPIYIDDPAALQVHELQSRARRAVARHGIGLLVIDYLQLLKGSSRQAQSSRYVEIGEVSRGIKAMAKELSIPVIALCQLNREADTRRHGVPKLSDLRESGDIEQDADLVGLLYRPCYYEKDPEARAEIEHLAFLDIAKQRSGPTGGGEAFKGKLGNERWTMEGCPGMPLKFRASQVKFENPDGIQMYG